jgi:hypothetical protein
VTTVAKRRLAKLEDGLRPREAVLAWLAEVQEIPDIKDYSRHVAEVPVDDAPMSVIARRVAAAVREDMRGQSREAIDDGVQRATGDALFLFVLVFQVNLEVAETAKVDGLRAAAVFLWMGCLLGGPRDEDLPPDDVAKHHRELTSGWANWFYAVDALERRVRVVDEARRTLAERFYAGHDVLFADAATDWASHVEQVERLTWFADGIRESPRGKAARRELARRQPPPTVDAGVEELVAWLTDWSKVRAFEVLGERPKAVAIMERRILAGADAAQEG